MNLFDMIAKSYSEVRSKLELPVQGTAAHDAAAVGNPVQVGGVYRATDPAVADGDVASLRLNAKGEAIVSVAGSNIAKKVSANFTRTNATDAYAAGDVVSDSTSSPNVITFANVGTAGETVVLTSSRLTVSKASTALSVPSGCTGWKLHLFTASPTAIADNAAFTTLAEADAAAGKYCGYITISTPIDVGYNLFSQDDNINKYITLVGTGLYGIIETIGAYTPTAQAVKTIDLFFAKM